MKKWARAMVCELLVAVVSRIVAGRTLAKDLGMKGVVFFTPISES